ncbi:putative tetratricopeptide-like helical domain superfamily, pentacotripeptide-repeat region of PRORP [Helianthus debilis subsp. tardiflorus]
MAFIYATCPSSSSVSFCLNNQIAFQSRNTQISERPNNLEPKISNPFQSTDHKKKSYIWVNPNSSKLTQKTYGSRYNSLSKVAVHLNSCSPVEKDVFSVLDSTLGGKFGVQNGLIILNNMSNAVTARIVLKYLLDRCDLSLRIDLYNATLIVFRKCKDLASVEQLFDEMTQRGVTPDIVTFSNIIGCARMCSLPGKAVAWFERMPEFEIVPDDAILSVMIDAYGRVGNVDKALMLYARARVENWSLSDVTYTTVIRICGTVGNFDECLTVFRERKARGIKPNLGCYNTLLDAIARGKRASDVKSIHREILSSGLRPGWATYAALLRAYCKARCGDDAMNVYEEMKEKGMVLNNALYNILLSTCANIGFVDEAITIFEDMKTSKDCQPDTRSFSLLITILSRHGKVSEAEAVLKEMLEAGFEHDIYVLTNLIQCYGKSNLRDDLGRTIDAIMELDLPLDERYCSCLLNVMTQVPLEDLGKVARCIDKADLKLGNVVKLVVECGGEDETFKNEASEVLARVGCEVRKTYCNCLIDLCIHLQKLDKASYFRTLL